MTKKTKQILIYVSVFSTIFVFIGFKLATLTFRFGDNNVYFYMAKAILNGNVPYRDFLLADPPVLVLILAGLRIIFGNWIAFYQALPVFFEAATALLLFLVLKKEKNSFAFLAPLIYLFSFSILATSDFLTGGQLVIFFSILGIFLWKKEKPFLAGIFWALACLVKLYAVPAFFGFMIFIFLGKNKKVLIRFIIGAAVSVVIFILPFLIIGFHQFIDYVIILHLNRPAGLSKINVFSFLFFREWLLLFLTVGGIITSKKKEFFYPFILSFVFFLLFQDIYYAYFDSFFAYIVIFAVFFMDWLWQRKKELFFSVLAVYFLFLLISLGYYQQTSFNENRFTNADEISDYVKTLPEKYDIYGSHEMAPLIALLSQKKIFGNYIETNAQGFSAGAQNLEITSEKAAKAGVILIARITDLPEYNIKDFGYEGYFSKNFFQKDCQRIKDFPSTANEQDNHIVLYKCEINSVNQ